jgi:hypothetical protein
MSYPNHLDMLELFAVLQIVHLQPNFFFQQDSASPWRGFTVRESLNKTLPTRWIGWDGPIHWSPHSPSVTPLDFFFWGYVKDKIFCPDFDNVVEFHT